MDERSPAAQATVAGTPPRRFDVFLSHNSRDKPIVERIAERLKRAGLEPWLDKWWLTPGGRWQEELAQALAASSACAVFISGDDVGAWEREEVAAALDRAAKDRSFRLFLVLLPGLPEPFEASALSPFLSTRTWVDFRGGVEETRALQALVNAVKGIPLGREVPLEPRTDICPYRGLQAFEEEDADFFFGRHADVQRLVEKLKRTSFLAVLGPSGSGKSSLVRAGLVPALRRGMLRGSDSWTIEILKPGAHPLDSLAAALVHLYPRLTSHKVRDELAADSRTLRLLVSRPPSDRQASERLVWVIDQFEEVFTLCRDERERRQFVLNLLNAAIPDGASAVIVTVRADFYVRCAAYAELAQQMAAQQFLVSPLTENGLRDAIEEPARRVGLELEPGLVRTILDDVRREPGALPLLEHALLELWERRRGALLTLEGYQESGGVEGALAKRADAVWQTLAVQEQAVARRVLLRLTQPGEGVEDTRRRAALSELVTQPAEAGAVESAVSSLAEARLLTVSSAKGTGERLVDVSHEALIRGWPLLRRWVDEDRQGLLVHRRLTEAAQEWKRFSRDDSLLYRGPRLVEARQWQERNEAALNELEREFLATSVQREERDRRSRRLRLLTVGVVLVLLAAGATTAAVLALLARNDARRQTRIAVSRQLAAQALEPAIPVDAALLVAVEGVRVHRTPEAVRSLLALLQRDPNLTALVHDGGLVGAFSPDGRRLVTGRGPLLLRDAATGRVLGPPFRVRNARYAAFSDDGKTITVGSDRSPPSLSGDFGAVRRFDVNSSRLIDPGNPALAGRWYSYAISADGTAVALFDPRTARIGVDVVAAGRHRIVVGPVLHWPNEFAVTSGGAHVVVKAGKTRSSLFVWNVRRKTLRTLPRRWEPARPILSSGGRLAVNLGSAILLYDVPTATRAGGIPVPPRLRTGLTLQTFSRDGRWLLAEREDGSEVIFDVRKRRLLRTLTSTLLGDQRIADAAPEKGLLFSRDASGGALWDIHRRRLVTPLAPYGGAADVAFGSDGRLVYARLLDRLVVQSWRVPTMIPLPAAEFSEFPGGSDIHLGARGSLLAGPGGFEPVPLLNLSTGRFLRPLRAISWRVDAIAVAAGGSRVVFVDDRARLVLWDASGGRALARTLIRDFDRAADDDNWPAVVISADGRTYGFIGRRGAFVVSRGRTFALGDLPAWGGTGLAFSDDGAVLALNLGGTIGLWRTRDGRRLDPDLEVASDSASTPLSGGIAFSHDGRTIAEAAYERVVLWDVATRRRLGTLTPVGTEYRDYTKIAFSPDDRRLAATGDLSAVNVWKIGVDVWVDVACRTAGRNLTRGEWRRYRGDARYRPTCPAG
jgi:WD40 repeat protein